MPDLSQRMLALPFPLHVNPLAGIVQNRLEHWASEFALTSTQAAGSRFAAAQFGIYAGYMQPEAPQEKLLTYAKFVAWLFLVNDQHGENVYPTPSAWRRAVEPLLPIFRTDRASPDVSDAPAARALADIVGIVYPCMSDCWAERFAEHCDQLFAAIDPESRHRQQQRIPPLDTYLPNRRIGSAGLPLIDLFEFCAGGELPPDVYGHTRYRELADATTDVMAWTNDILSLEKELAAGEVDNLVVVFQHAHRLSRQGAIRLVEDRVLQRVEDFRRADRALLRDMKAMRLSEASRNTLDFCRRSMQHWMIGNVVWGQHNPRYSQPLATDSDTAAVEDLLRADNGPHPALATSAERSRRRR
ncbi:terpene synthase family protein [Nocardia thraciensis]